MASWQQLLQSRILTSSEIAKYCLNLVIKSEPNVIKNNEVFILGVKLEIYLIGTTEPGPQEMEALKVGQVFGNWLEVVVLHNHLCFWSGKSAI